MRNRIGIICIAIFLMGEAVGLAQPAQDVALKKLLSNLNQTYASLKDFEAEFVQTEINALLNRKKKSMGIIYSISGGKVFWYTQRPHAFKALSDGKRIWLYYPVEKQLFSHKWGTLDTQTKLALLFLRMEGDLGKHFNIAWKNKIKNIITLIPKEKINVNKIELMLTPKNVFLKKLTFYFPLERTTELALKNVKFNQKLWKRHQKTALDVNINKKFEFQSTD